MRSALVGGGIGILAAVGCAGSPTSAADADLRTESGSSALGDAGTEAEGTAPDAEEPDPRSARAPSIAWPVAPVHVTSDFGWRTDPVSGKGTRLHKGIDLRGAIGDLVLSVADGTVRFAGHDPLLGNMIVVDHGDGLESWYGHMSDLLVHDGLPVNRGAPIGLVGNSGRSAAPHLHLTMKLDGEPIDPRRLLGLPQWAPRGWLPPAEP